MINNLFTAEEIVDKVNKSGFTDFTKRNFYYYLYDKKMYGAVTKDKKSYSEDILTKTLQILNLKNNSRYTLDEIKEIIQNCELYKIVENNVNCSYCTDVFSASCEINPVTNLCSNNTIKQENSILNYDINNLNPDTTKTFTQNIVPNYYSPLYSEPNISNFNFYNIYFGKEILTINENITILYNSSATKEVLKIAELFIEEKDKNKIEQIEIKFTTYEKIIKFLKIVNNMSLLKEDVYFYINDINISFNKNRIFDIKLNDIIQLKGKESLINKFKKDWEA